MQYFYRLLVLITFYTSTLSAQVPFEVTSPQYGFAFAGMASDDPNAPGGYSNSANLPRQNANALDLGEGDIYLYVDTTSEALFKENFGAHTVYLVNQSNESQAFLAADSRLYLFAEVYIDGDWLEIERMPMITCGNSYHHVQLEADEYWMFTVPKYGGEISVPMRYRCYPKGVYHLVDEEPISIVSPTFTAHIDSGQLKKNNLSPQDN